MLTHIGGARRPRGGEDVVEALLDCHDRIRSFLALGRRLATDTGTAAEVREAAAAVRRYFTQALPLHALDEEASVLPRLRDRERALDEALAEMAREHREHTDPIAGLMDACNQLIEEPALREALAPSLSAVVSTLEQDFVRHLAREEERVFPALRRLLGPAERATIRAEMLARRGPAGSGR